MFTSDSNRLRSVEAEEPQMVEFVAGAARQFQTSGGCRSGVLDNKAPEWQKSAVFALEEFLASKAKYGCASPRVMIPVIKTGFAGKTAFFKLACESANELIKLAQASLDKQALAALDLRIRKAHKLSDSQMVQTPDGELHLVSHAEMAWDNSGMCPRLSKTAVDAVLVNGEFVAVPAGSVLVEA